MFYSVRNCRAVRLYGAGPIQYVTGMVRIRYGYGTDMTRIRYGTYTVQYGYGMARCGYGRDTYRTDTVRCLSSGLCVFGGGGF